MQPSAIRKRRQREKAAVVTPAVTQAASTAAGPVTVTPPPAAAVEAPRAVPRDVTPIARSATFALLETEVVTGPGAEAFAGPTVLGADDQGAGGTPLVTPPPPEAPPVTSREEAALIGKAVGAYVGLGWGLMASRHQDALVGLADTLLRGHPQLGQLTPEQKYAFGFGALIGVVEDSTTAVVLKHNIRIPYQDEGIVAVAIGTATFGIAREFRARNDNRGPSSSSAPASSPPAAAPRDVSPPDVQERTARATSRDVTDARDANAVELDDTPSARANRAPVDAELVL